MNNVENPWLQEEQKKLIAEAFPAWWKSRIIPWIRTYNLQQLPPSDRPKRLSAEHKAQLISAMNLELGQHSATARTLLRRAIRRPQPAALTGASLARAGPCPAYYTIVIITLLKFHWEMAEAQSIYWYFPATRNGIVTNASWEEHLMPFCELPAGRQQEGQRTTYQEIPPGSMPTSQVI